MSESPFSFDRSGAIQVSVDGPEVLVYSGEGVPMWKGFLQGIGVAVHAAAQRVATFDTDGRMLSFTSHDGTPVVDVSLDVAPVAVAGARDGRCAVVADDCVLLVSRDGESYRLPHAGGLNASFGGPGQTHLGVVGSDGVLTVFDTQSAAVICTAATGVSPVDVGYSGLGRWVVLGAGQLHQYAVVEGVGLSGTSLDVLRVVPVAPDARQLEIADDGVICAITVGDREVRILELWTDRICGGISFNRTVSDLCFGAGSMLGIGLEDGDSNRVNLTVGGSWRSSPGFGRGHTTWACNVQVDHVTLRSAVIAATAGGGAVAQVVLRQESQKNTVMYALGGFFAVCALCGCWTTVLGTLLALLW